MLRNKKKGFIAGVAMAFAVIGLLTSMLIFGAFLKFMSDSEKKLSDRVYFGLSAINYFYFSEKNINEFTQIVTEITAKELGEQCGGFYCYSWSADNPSYSDLRDKFDETLRGKITGFPAQIGNGGRISFAPPKIAGLEMDESHVKISLEPQQVYRKTNSFFVNASSEEPSEINKQIRYLLLAKIGQKLYGNGTYVRDAGRIWINSGKFDCNNDGDSSDAGETISAKTKMSGANLNGCKILDINFDVDDASWNSYKTNCYSITNSSDSGINAGKVEGGKIYVQIDSLLEKSLICGIDMTDGLTSITDIYGQDSEYKEGSWPSCSIDDAENNAWQNSGVGGKISSILNTLAKVIGAEQTGIKAQASASLGIYPPEESKSGWTVNCGSMYYDTCGCPSKTRYCKNGDICRLQASFTCYACGECKSGEATSYCLRDVKSGMCVDETFEADIVLKTPTVGSETGCSCTFYDCGTGIKCQSTQYCGVTQCDDNLPYSCAAAYSSGWCSFANSCSYSGDRNEGSISRNDSYSCSGPSSRWTSSTKNWYSSGYFLETKESRSCGSNGCYTPDYKCTLGAYFKFTFTPDISFRIVDNTIKIVKKGTTDFEDLYFAVKFKPGEPYVIGG